jgi:ABC-type lipoprotein release transport system permease subunit
VEPYNTMLTTLSSDLRFAGRVLRKSPLGLILAAAATRLIAGFLFGVSPLDAGTFVAMSILFVAVAMVASYLPARRAAAADPVLPLRAE